MSPKQKVVEAYPEAVLMHVPLSMAVAIYCAGRMIGSESVDAERAWESALRIIKGRKANR